MPLFLLLSVLLFGSVPTTHIHASSISDDGDSEQESSLIPPEPEAPDEGESIAPAALDDHDAAASEKADRLSRVEEKDATNPAIRITLSDDALTVGPMLPGQTLPTEYAVGTTIEIATTLEVANKVALFEQSGQTSPIPIEMDSFSQHVDPVDADSKEERLRFSVHLLRLGDWCFRVKPLLHLELSTQAHCLQVLPSKIVSEETREIIITDARNKDPEKIKAEILAALGMHDQDETAEHEPAAAEAAKPDTAKGGEEAGVVPPGVANRRLRGEAESDALSESRSSVGSASDLDHDDHDHDEAHDGAGGEGAENKPGPQLQIDGNVNVIGNAAPLPDADVMVVPDRPDQEKKADAGGEEAKEEPGNKTPAKPEPAAKQPQEAEGKDSAQQPEAAKKAADDAEEPDASQQHKEEKEEKKGKAAEKHDAAKQPDEDAERAGMLPGDKHKSPTMIGINLAFETLGILVRHLDLQKLLFLVQHIVSALLPELNEHDVFITLPTSQSLTTYHTATASERVAIIIGQARQRRPKLHNSYELEYSSNMQDTFGGRIILQIDEDGKDTTAQSKALYDVPAQTLDDMADLMVTIGPYHVNNVDEIAISIGHQPSALAGKDKYICLEPIASLRSVGYDELNLIATKIARCMFKALGIRRAALNFDININPADGKVTAAETSAAAAAGEDEVRLIEFDMQRQEEKCCSIALSPNAKKFKMFPDDYKRLRPKVRQIILLRGDAVTVNLDESVVNKSQIAEPPQVKDVVFYVDVVDALLVEHEQFTLEQHPKFQALHDLLYSPGEAVPVPTGLWNLCVSWTSIGAASQDSTTTPTTTTTAASLQTEQRIHKCSDSLYLNANWDLSDKQEQLLAAYDASHGEMSYDSSGFLYAQLLHLESILSEIYAFRDELNANTENDAALYDKLLQHRHESQVYFKHLHELQSRYLRALDASTSNAVKIDYLQSRHTALQEKLARDAKMEQLYAQKLAAFKHTELDDEQKKAEAIKTQIQSSQEQIERLEDSLQEQEKLLHELEVQGKSMTKSTSDDSEGGSEQQPQPLNG